MPAGLPNRPTRRRGAALASLTIGALALTGCYHNPDPTDYGSAAKANFVAGCSTEVKADNNTTTSIAIASKSTCECIYELIKAPESGEKGKYPLEWDDLKDYEQKQSDAKAGDLPTPPKQLTKAIAECEPAGPAAG